MYKTKGIIDNELKVNTICSVTSNSNKEVSALYGQWIVNAKSMLCMLAICHSGDEVTFISDDKTTIECIADVINSRIEE